jgi:dTDP-4-dehydrorhamnose reductase
LAIVRTAWLYGPPGNDFPGKILAAAERARSTGVPLRLVNDEWGSPTSAADVADAIVELVGSGAIGGTYHFANTGVASRADWAREILRLACIEVSTEEVPASTWPRLSTPPRWGVMGSSALPSGEPMRPWREALADEAPWLVRVAAEIVAAARASAPAGATAGDRR